MLASILQKRVEFAGNLRTRARQRAGIALAVAGAIVGANSGEIGNLSLRPLPLAEDIAQAALKNYCGATLSRAVDFQSMAADIHQTARFR